MVEIEVRAEEGPLRHCFNEATGQNSLHATTSFTAGDVITKFSAAKTYKQPNMYTVQVSASEHIDLSPHLLSFTNHSCQPNAFFNTSTWCFEALQDIQPSDQLTFFYPSTEYHMAEPFTCNCGTAACLEQVAGACSLEKHLLAKYRLNDHIHKLLDGAGHAGNDRQE